MSVTTESPGACRGRNSSGLASSLRIRIASGEFPAGEYLPTVRDLSEEHGVSRETVRRAVKSLEGEGLVAAEARHGYRVLATGNDPERGLPVAFAVSVPPSPGLWSEFNQMLFAALHCAAAERGWLVLAVSAERGGGELAAQLSECRASGIVLDTMSPDLLDTVEELGLPAVMIDSWDPAMRLDAVVQDGFQGALLAARYLAKRGHRRIGWLGPITEGVQSQERFGGAVAGLCSAGIELVPELLRDTPRAEVREAARRMLSRPDRPGAVLALWHGAAAALVAAAGELGLRLGRDLEMVGWTPEEQYETVYRAVLGNAPRPATMVWNCAETARVAIARLAERRAAPEAGTVLVKVPMRMVDAEELS